MENVIKKGFISPKGIMIYISSIGSDPYHEVEIVAQSICKNIEHCIIPIGTIKENQDIVYQTYLIEKFGYIYIELLYLDNHIEIKNIKTPKMRKVTLEQQMKIEKLCEKKPHLKILNLI